MQPIVDLGKAQEVEIPGIDIRQVGLPQLLVTLLDLLSHSFFLLLDLLLALLLLEMWRLLLVQEQDLLLGLIKHVVEPQELLE